jgi:hypothetical protein
VCADVVEMMLCMLEAVEAVIHVVEVVDGMRRMVEDQTNESHGEVLMSLVDARLAVPILPNRASRQANSDAAHWISWLKSG